MGTIIFYAGSYDRGSTAINTTLKANTLLTVQPPASTPTPQFVGMRTIFNFYTKILFKKNPPPTNPPRPFSHPHHHNYHHIFHFYYYCHVKALWSWGLVDGY